ncbi:MAG: SPOR domain-containing protein [Proteobacteria bacterium]|nr:SPOR domain-containing protein [Pseudomonadota bacterium]
MHQEFDPRDLEPSLPKREERPVRSKIAPIMIAAVALDTSPTKVRPEQPGGMEVQHQDKLVLNTLADGAKPGAPAVERLLPPPETPLPRPAAAAPVTPPPAVAAAPNPTAPALPPKIGPAPPAAGMPATPPAAPAQIATAPPPSPAPAPPTAIAAPATPPAAKSPPEKPQAVAAAAPPKPSPAAAVNGAAYRVQLVSVKSQTETNQEWARLQRSHPELAPLHMSVTRVDLGDKGVWYRIYGGPFSDAAAAGRLCDSLKAKNQGCVVAKP